MVIPTRSGYSFSGWNTAPDGSGAHYAADESISSKSDMTLYAEWTRTANLVTGQVGTASPGERVTYYYDADEVAYHNGSTDTSVGVSLAPNESAGWEALGWTKDPSSTTADYDPSFTMTDAYLTSASENWYAIGERDLSLSYDGNGADSGTAPAAQGGGTQVYNASGAAPLPTDTFTVAGKGDLGMDGRVFAGWNTESDGSGTMYQEGDQITTAEPLVLYAQWAYPVTYDVNGGRAGTAPAAQQKLPGTGLALHSGKPSRDPDTADITTTLDYNYTGAPAADTKKTRRSEAWKFTGWNTEAGGTGTPYGPGDAYAADAAATLYAQWEVQNPVYGSTALPTPAWEGHDFLGWTPQENPSDEELAAALPGGSTYRPTADGTLYAQWKLKTYEVVYDANGAGVSNMPDPATAEKAHGVDLTLSDKTPARASVSKDIALTLNYKGGSYLSGDDSNVFGTGHDSATQTITTTYAFGGWNTQAAGGGTPYAAGARYAANAPATLYAIWQPSTTGYATYRLPDASRTSATSVAYRFEGWSTSPTAKKGDAGIMAAGTDYRPTADTTLYAVWDPPTYAIEYDGNAGGDAVTGDLGMQTKEADVDVTLHAAPTRTRPADSFAVSYDANGGSVSPTAANTTAANTTAYAFKGWAEAANIGSASDGVVTDDEWDAYAAGKKFAESDLNYAANADLKLYAQWTKTGSVSPVTLPAPTRDGYEFDGWYTAAAGGTRAGGAGDAYTPSGDATLFARWTPRTYTVTYDANAGGGATVTNMPSPLSETKTHDADLALSASEPARADESGDVAITYDAHGGSTPAAGSSRYESRYGFLSWKKDGNTYAPGAAYKEEGDATLYAQWAESTTYAAVTLPDATREGHSFLGWFTAETGGDEAGDAGDQYTPTSKAGVTLHAHWKADTYPVAYDMNTDDAVGNQPDPNPATKTYGEDLALAGAPTREPTVTDEFTVTFDRRGGTGSPDSAQSRATVQHVFKGWTTVDTVGAAKGEATDAEWDAYAGAKYEAGGTYADNAGATLYAQWGDEPAGAELTLPAAPTPPAGFDFKGWSLSRDTAPDDATGALLAPGSKVYPYEDTVYYAIYDPPVYVVSYDANGGTGEPASQYKRHGEDLGLSGDEPARAGATEQYRVYYDAAGGSATAERSEELTATASYAFRGWAEDASVGAEAGIADDAEWAAYDSAKKHDRGDAYTADADLDLFAQWKRTVASDPASVALPAADRPGWTFLGWYDAGGDRAGGAGDAYAPKGADETLAARWQQYSYPSDGEAFAYTVVFEQEDGTRIATQGFEFGAPQRLDAGPTPTAPAGKVFAGWRLKGGASTFAEHQLVSNLTNVDGGEVTLVAQWKDAPAGSGGGGGADPADPDNPEGYNYYTVEYWEQGTDGAMYRRESTDRIFADTGDAAEVPATALDAPLGFHVDGEKTVASGTVEADGATKLEVYWARNQFDVEFDAGAADATGTMEKQRLVWASGETLTPNAFTRPGWRFAGWKVTERDGAQLAAQSEGGLTVQSILDAVAGLFLGAQAADGSVADASDGSRLTPTDIADGGHVTLTARWERGSSGGGSGDPAGPAGPTDPTDPDDPADPDDPGDPKDPRDELADKIREAEDLVDPDLHPGRPASPDEEKKLRDEIDEAKKVLDDQHDHDHDDRLYAQGLALDGRLGAARVRGHRGEHRHAGGGPCRRAQAQAREQVGSARRGSLPRRGPSKRCDEPQRGRSFGCGALTGVSAQDDKSPCHSSLRADALAPPTDGKLLCRHIARLPNSILLACDTPLYWGALGTLSERTSL